MGYHYKELTFPSSDGKNTCHAEIYMPDGEVRGVVQLAHGMRDYVGRYRTLAEYLTSRGYVLAGNDHLGHGRTAASAEDYGYFAREGGVDLVIDDVGKMNEILHEEFPGKRLVLMGHSMGSFIARLYAIKYRHTIDGLIIHGTSGPNLLLGAGRALAGLIGAFLGRRHRSRLITSMAFGSYNSRFDKSEGPEAWLTRDGSMVADRVGNPYTDFMFTISGYEDLFELIGDCNMKGWYRCYPTDLPTLIMSGEEDPVGDFGKGVRRVYDGLLKHGVTNLTMKLYEGARHELFNEIPECREMVFADMSQWLSEYCACR